MKLRIVRYDRARNIGCKDDVVWFINQIDDNGKCSLVGWNYKTRIPNITEGRVKWYMAYYSYELAEAAFEQIKNYYYENGGFRTIKEVELKTIKEGVL